MPTWDEIRNGIFAGESGGDYDAIYGYQNRDPNSRFAGVRPSQMTVSQVVDFTQPNNAYGQHVKNQIGRVATPVGAYQVVGKTLRAAVDALGLDPSQPFDRDTQDRIGKWIYETQGTGAWKGYMGPRDTAPQSYHDLSGQSYSTKGGGMEEGSNWDRIIAASAGAQTNRGPLANALLAFAQNAPRMYRGQGMDFSGTTQQAGTSKNKSIEWLLTAGRRDLAAAVASGALEPKDAIALIYREGKDGGKTYSPISDAEAAELGLPPGKKYQRGSDGQITAIGGGGVEVNIGDKPLTEGQAKSSLYHTMMVQALPVIEQFETQGLDFWQNLLPGWVQSDEYRAYDAAASAFSEAFLRATSGATITQDDINVNKKSMFPMPGDPPGVVENKRKMRKAVLDALRLGTGVAPGARPPAAGAPGAPSAAGAPGAGAPGAGAPGAPGAPAAGYDPDPLGIRG